MNSKSILTIAVSVLLFVFILNGASFAQETLHVTSVHDRTTSEKSAVKGTPEGYQVIEGVIGSKKYILSDTHMLSAYHCEVGADYPVLKLMKFVVEIEVPGKKGPKRLMLSIESVTE